MLVMLGDHVMPELSVLCSPDELQHILKSIQIFQFLMFPHSPYLYFSSHQ